MTVVNIEGDPKGYDFSSLALPEPMSRSLTAAFADQSGGWSSHASAQAFWGHLQLFARFLNSLDRVPDDLDGLNAATLKRWRARYCGTAAGARTLTAVRALLHRDGRLRAGAAGEELARRILLPASGRSAYGKAERERVVLAAQRQFRAAWMRIRENSRLLDLWRAEGLDVGSREWQLGEILDYVARTGDVPRTAGSDGRARMTGQHVLGGGAVELTWGRLFLTRGELTALAVLLTDRFGWNLSVCDRLPVPSSMPSAGETHSVTYRIRIEKRRAGAGRWFSWENITDSGADSPGRLITQALEATAHGRALAAGLAPGTDLLMVARTGSRGYGLRQDPDRPRPVGCLSLGVSHGDVKLWAGKHGLDRSPFQRMRRSTVVREGRPLQHTPGTHESVYVLPDRQVQRASREVFVAGAQAALDRARSAVFAGRLADRRDPGDQETVTVDCADEAASPWPAPGGGCAADFLLCLACPNAHVHPGHHPRLALLLEHLKGLRSAVPEDIWAGRWNDHFLRLEDLSGRIGPTAWSAARSRADERDRVLVGLLLKGEFAP